MLRPTLSKKDASPRAVALLEALHEPFSVEERLWIIEGVLKEEFNEGWRARTKAADPEPVEHG